MLWKENFEIEITSKPNYVTYNTANEDVVLHYTADRVVFEGVGEKGYSSILKRIEML